MTIRPLWCQDCSCAPHSNTISPNDGPGSSTFCCGAVPEPMITERHGVLHENDGHFCFQSPRGVAMFEINATDLDLIARVCLRSLVEREPDRGFNWRWYTGRPSLDGDHDRAPSTQTKQGERSEAPSS